MNNNYISSLYIYIPLTYSITSFSEIFDPGCFTTNAIGNSPHSSSGTPTTAASFTPKCVNINASNSAGATCSGKNI